MTHSMFSSFSASSKIYSVQYKYMCIFVVFPLLNTAHSPHQAKELSRALIGSKADPFSPIKSLLVMAIKASDYITTAYIHRTYLSGLAELISFFITQLSYLR